MRPNFLVIGCEKCGTTALCAMLGRHPDVFVCEPKEPHFLSFNYDKGWDWYESLFEPGQNALARGEGSVSYATDEYEELICQRLSEHLPDIKLIYIVRHPVKRVESSFRFLHSGAHPYGVLLPLDIGKALAYRPHMVRTTLYWERINAFRNHLPDNRILLLFQEDLKTQPRQTLDKCFSFLGVEPGKLTDFKSEAVNESKHLYRDTQLLRYIRRNPVLSKAWHTLPWRLTHWLEPKLRKPWNDNMQIHWNAAARQKFLQHIRPDAQQFLQFCGKPMDYWDLRS